MNAARQQHRMLLTVVGISVLAADLAVAQSTATRALRAEDLFRVRRVGAVAWSPGGRFATIEFTKPSPWLDGVPANDLALLDAAAGKLRPLSPRSPLYVGFFGAVWSPDGRRVAFLSVDSAAVVRPWVWRVGDPAAALIRGLEARIGINDPPLAWIDNERLAVMAWEVGAEQTGPLHVRILRGRNTAERSRRALDPRTAAVSVVESRPSARSAEAAARLVVLHVRTGARKTLARGLIHRLAVSADRCCVIFLEQDPGVPEQPVAAYFERAEHANDVEAGYAAVNWGTARRVIDAGSGLPGPAEAVAPAPRKAQTPKTPASPPYPNARQLSVAPSADAALYLAEEQDGSRLWLSGGAGRALTSSVQIWRANEWLANIKLGRAESVRYQGTDGTELVAWLLLPPDHVSGTSAPVVTIVYPGTVYGPRVPSRFSAFQSDFEHPQLFAALGYAVLLPSMPEPKSSADTHALEPLTAGVLPAVEAVVSKGLADTDRIAVLGQSAGGFAALGLITQTNRFRSAIASASYSDLVSLYGTFYGQYRHGDSGRAEVAQVLRMLQLEKGVMGLGAPPWIEPDRYRTRSALWRADQVRTPLMLIHGELDFVPIQQAEEFFTALFRQDKRVVLLRYAGEGHTISGAANVIDLWNRMADWLAETMPPRR